MNSSHNTPIDVDTLISAIKSRPPLYSRNERYETGHKQKKKRLWQEVCKDVNPEYVLLSNTDKREFEREVYKRWRSLRTCFTRELALQRREKLAKISKRRKIYEHFDTLRFLLTEYGDDVQDETMQTLQFDSDDEAEVNEFEESSRSDVVALRNIKSEIEEDYPETEIYIEPENSGPLQRSSLDPIDDAVSRQEADCDKLFMLSLIPSFRRIDPRKKLAAKIELMKVLQSFQED